MGLRRAAKSGRFLRRRIRLGGVFNIAIILPPLVIATGSPSSSQLNTLPKRFRSCVTVALFM
jgi:hypothetical protein